MPPGALAGLRLVLVGAGRVGLSLTAWAKLAGATVVAVASPTASSRTRAVAQLDPGWIGPPEQLDVVFERDFDLLLLAVNDGALTTLAQMLARRVPAHGFQSAPPVALHTSGALTAAVLAPLAAAGAAVGSLHPLHAFPTALFEPTAGRGIVFGIDGDPPALQLARRLAAAFGASAVEVPAAARLLYHFGATMAAGGVVALVASASQLSRQLGLGDEIGRGYLALARGALTRAAELETPDLAITGPLQRGDVELVRRQLTALAAAAPRLEPLAVTLAAATLELLLALPAAGNTAGDEAVGGLGSDPRRVAQQALSVELAARWRVLLAP